MVNPEEAARIINESIAILERTKHIAAPREPAVRSETMNERHIREIAEQDAEWAKQKKAQTDTHAVALRRLQDLLQQYVAQQDKATRVFIFDVMAGVIAEQQARMEAHVAKEIKKLRAELSPADKFKVVDLPPFLRKASA
jgi:hypothetical protein